MTLSSSGQRRLTSPKNHARVLVRECKADRVGEIHYVRPGGDHFAAHARNERWIGTGRVLARELDLVGAGTCVGDCPGGLRDDLVRGEPQLLLHVDRARRQDDVDTRAVSVPEGLGACIEVLTPRTAEGGDRCATGDGRDGTDALEVAGRRGSEPGFDHVDAEPLELLCDLYLLFRPQGDARRLLAISKGRVENLDPARTHYNLLSGHV